ncbi:MAG: lysylphosphatidylglycerol synthase transmembrane domain-containing protein, partial [Chloroflexota bacterium]
ALTLWNYALRFAKWHLYLRTLRIPASLADSLGIFLCGLSMAITPGKVGELLKSVLLRRRVGTPLSVSAPVIFAERLTDGLAMMGLAATGLILYQQAVRPMLVLLAVFAAAIVVVQLPASRDRVLPWLQKHPRLVQRAESIGQIYRSARLLLAPPLLAAAVAIGLLSWSGECAAFYLVLHGLGFSGGWNLLIQAAFVLAVSTLVGSASLLPGGLGTAEGSAAALLIAVSHAGLTDAIAATLIIRLCTLWFGVAVGCTALFVYRHRFDLSWKGITPDPPGASIAG